MHSQKERLSYDRLIARAQFYQEKSLELEKKLVFAEEKIEKLEKDAADSSRETELQALEAERTRLKEEAAALKMELEQARRVDYDQRVADYEELLSSVQKEMNEKEIKLDLSQQKIKALEKKLSLLGRPDPFMKKAEDEEEESIFVKRDYECLCLFDYSVIMNDNQSGLIKGSFIIENTGLISLLNPSVCLRFNPVEANVIKGKIYSSENHEVSNDNLANFQWMFVDNDWSQEAKERGEVWICPLREMSIEPGEKAVIQDYQIPFKKEVIGNLTVEAFVFFNKQQYKVKAANHIAINF
ncbi:hypothetical protein [Fictibacillus terranigra]|uniref:Uncharacterized protein n=1 Tax=Fictibacillus terranigra TaxID=3058424 RepID=A0ABT8E6W9_9BACL|nr:hypothetical protein [Fictibacillus sp. CENA-BCM004]MDN4073651.1 hypothetical protein [Fictibacillus sp. CENA-BCM004]